MLPCAGWTVPTKDACSPAPRPALGPPRSTSRFLSSLQGEQGPRDQDPSPRDRQGRYAADRPPTVLLGGGSRGSGSSGGRPGLPPRRKRTQSAVVVSWVASVSMASASPTKFLQCPGRAQGGRLPKPKLGSFLALSLAGGSRTPIPRRMRPPRNPVLPPVCAQSSLVHNSC